MTEDQYINLCKCCDSIRVAEESIFERMAITWLHVVREHHVFLKQYEGIFLPKPATTANLLNNWRTALLDYARTVRAGWQFFRYSRKRWCGDLPSGAPVDFVFVYHLLNLSQLSGEDVFYFGKFPADLIRQGKSVVVVLINHSDMPADDVEDYLAASSIPRLVISSVLSPRDELRILRRTIDEAGRLKHAATIETPDVRRTILSKASIEATSPVTWASLRIAKLVGEVISHCQPRRVVTTYEGRSFQRLVYAAGRELSRGISCIGYQHAAMRLQHAAKRSIGTKFDPDKSLCAGPVGLGQLQRSRYLPKVQLAILGPNRSMNNLTCNGVSTCLVLPEGITEECEVLFQFSLSCARAHLDLLFIWRLHPILSFDKLVRRKGKLEKLPPNIEISTKLLVEDISRGSLVLYRGSTAAITAAANGVLPIYVERPVEPTIDPMFEISDHHPNVHSIKAFSAALEWTKWTAEARTYCHGSL